VRAGSNSVVINVQDIAINRVTDGHSANNWSLCICQQAPLTPIQRLAPHSTSKTFCARHDLFED
jgi:hypothetical protein